MKRVLVTGGMGYIGSHTVVQLLEQGYEPILADNLSNSHPNIHDRIRQITGKSPLFHQVDLADYEACTKLFEVEKDIDSIIHFAAYKAVGESVQEPIKYYRNNIDSLLNLLDCMTQFSVDSMVFSSSCTVYGQPDTLPVSESAPFKKAESPYGYTKQVCERIIQDYVQADPKKKGIALRYFNPIGAHDSALIGELPHGVPQNLVPFVTQTAIGLRDELQVYGSDYDTADGSAVRDYIHVMDLAQAHVLAVERLLKVKHTENYEFSTWVQAKDTRS